MGSVVAESRLFSFHPRNLAACNPIPYSLLSTLLNWLKLVCWPDQFQCRSNPWQDSIWTTEIPTISMNTCRSCGMTSLVSQRVSKVPVCMELFVQVLSRNKSLLLHLANHSIWTLPGLLFGHQLCMSGLSAHLVHGTLSSHLENQLCLLSYCFHSVHGCIAWTVCGILRSLFCQDQSSLSTSTR